jgi:SPP1 family predicted phage head-tail adaptor
MLPGEDWPRGFPPDPGSFRHLVTFLKQMPVSDASGTSVQWFPSSPPETAWAKIETLRATDVIKSGQTVSQVYLTVTMWYRAGVESKDRIFGPNGKQYVVQAVENVLERNVYLVLTCVALAGNN